MTDDFKKNMEEVARRAAEIKAMSPEDRQKLFDSIDDDMPIAAMENPEE
jgi:hypothetical protein